MQDQNLRVTRTHSADEFEGSLFGIDVIHFKWIALTLLAGLAIFAGLFYGRGFGFRRSGTMGIVPAGGVFPLSADSDIRGSRLATSPICWIPC